MADHTPEEDGAVIDVFGDCFEPRDGANYSDVTLLPNQETKEFGDQSSSLSVTVCDPEKHATFFETYLRYRVRTHSSREEFGSQQHDLHRRYNDFLWLRDRLEETHPTFVIPPFPPKHSMSAFERFSGPFISARCAALQRFISRVCEHPVLSTCNDLFNFLTVKEQDEWLRYKTEFKPSAQWLGKIKDLVQAGEVAPEFEGCLPKLELCIGACDQLAATGRRIMAEEQLAAKETAQFADSLSKWSSESGHVPCVGNILYHLAQAFDAQAQDLLPTALCLQSNFIPDALDIAAYAGSVKKVVIRRNKLQGLIRDTNDSAGRVEESLDKPSVISRKVLRQSIEAERHQKEEKLHRLRSRSGSLRSTLEAANADLTGELDAWSRQRAQLLRHMLLELAGQRIAHFRRVTQLWSQTEENIQQTLARS